MLSTNRMKVLQTAAIPVVRAMRAVFCRTLRHNFVLLADPDPLTLTMAFQSRLERR